MSDKEREEFEGWYANYFDGCCAVFGGIDCTNHKGVADDAWQASAERYQSRIAELEAEVVRLRAAGQRSLDWLASYPGVGANGCLLQMREAMKGGA